MTMKIALVEMDGVQFGLAVVSEDAFDDASVKMETHRFLETRVFRELPVVLVSENFLTATRFYGRQDLSEFMAGVRMEMIEWTELELPSPPPGVS